jgi:hypothetical protein
MAGLLKLNFPNHTTAVVEAIKTGIVRYEGSTAGPRA